MTFEEEQDAVEKALVAANAPADLTKPGEKFEQNIPEEIGADPMLPGRDFATGLANPLDVKAAEAAARERMLDLRAAGEQKSKDVALVIDSFRDVSASVDPGIPRGTMLDEAAEYAALRHKLDRADDETREELLRAVVRQADEMAIRVTHNPTSRIRPAHDRRQGGEPKKQTVTVPIQTMYQTSIGGELEHLVDEPEGLRWVLAQRAFHAKIDFQIFRLKNDVIAVSEIETTIDLRLHCRTAPASLTNGKDIILPPEIDNVTVYKQPGNGYRDADPNRYARVGYGDIEVDV